MIYSQPDEKGGGWQRADRLAAELSTRGLPAARVNRMASAPEAIMSIAADGVTRVPMLIAKDAQGRVLARISRWVTSEDLLALLGWET